MTSIRKCVATAAVIGALLTSSVASATAPTAQAAPAAATAQINPWTVLSIMSGSVPAATACGAAAAVATTAQPSGCVLPQTGVVPPPPPPPAYVPPPVVGAGFGGIPIPVIAILLATLLADIYIATHNFNNHPVPNSPV